MLTQRFWDKVDTTDLCWNWKASKDRGGYKKMTCPDCGDTVYETDCGISCHCGFETLDETEMDN